MPDDPADGATHTPGAPLAPEEDRPTRARMLNYRLVPLWFFLVSFGVLVAWDLGINQAPATAGKLQATVIISLIIAFAVGAPIGIRFFNPMPPKT